MSPTSADKLPAILEVEDITFGHPMVELKSAPALDPGNALVGRGLTHARILSWPGGGAAKHALVYMGRISATGAPSAGVSDAGRNQGLSLSAQETHFIDLISRQITRALSQGPGELLDRLDDLERRGDLVRSSGQKRVGRRTTEAILDARNLQTLHDIAIRFKSGVSLPDLFNTYLLTLMGRLRLKRAAVYVSTLPSTRFIRFLSKGRPWKGQLPLRIDIEDLPRDRLWINLKDHREANRGNVFVREGFSVAWILSRKPRGESSEGVLALVYMGAGEEVRFSAGDLKFIEILNHQIMEIMNLLDSVRPAGGSSDGGTLLNWDENISALIQENIWDPSSFDRHGISCRIFFRPTHKVGGDFFDFHPLKDGSFGVAVGDVVGHGIPAAMWTQAVREELRRIVGESESAEPGGPAEVLRKLNAVLLTNQKSEIPVSLCYGILNPRRRTFTYSSAGIDYPLLFRPMSETSALGAPETLSRPSTGRCYELSAGGLFLGCLPDVLFSQETVPLGADDVLMIYTDGLQPISASGWTEQAVQSLRQKSPGSRPIDVLYGSIAHLADLRQKVDDDKTSILLSLPADVGDIGTGGAGGADPAGSASRISASGASSVGVSDSDPTPQVPMSPTSAGSAESADDPAAVHRLVLPADVRHLSTLRVFIGNMIRFCGDVSAEESFAIGFTAEDAVVNSIQHGYGGAPGGTVAIEILPGADGISILVRDTGCGFDFDPGRIPQFLSEEELYRSNGRGLYMMFRLMDKVDVSSRVSEGTTVKLFKHLRRNPHGA